MDYVAESKRMFDDGDYQWKNALAFDLHHRNPLLAAQWAILCAERLLTLRFPDRLPDLLKDIDSAKIRVNSPPDADDPIGPEYEIWCRPNRDAPQTAMSKIFTAIRELHQRSNCVVASSAVIANLVADDWGGISGTCTSIECFDIVLQSYYDVLHANATNPENENVG
jgi:hypothetical protein